MHKDQTWMATARRNLLLVGKTSAEYRWSRGKVRPVARPDTNAERRWRT